MPRALDPKDRSLKRPRALRASSLLPCTAMPNDSGASGDGQAATQKYRERGAPTAAPPDNCRRPVGRNKEYGCLGAAAAEVPPWIPVLGPEGGPCSGEGGARSWSKTRARPRLRRRTTGSGQPNATTRGRRLSGMLLCSQRRWHSAKDSPLHEGPIAVVAGVPDG